VKGFPENNRLAAIWFEQYLLVGVKLSEPVRAFRMAATAANFASGEAEPTRWVYYQ